MKKRMLSLLLGVLLLTAVLPAGVYAADGVAINEVNFPDQKFRSYVKKYCDMDGDMHLSAQELEETLAIDVYDQAISSLQGIEFFTDLESLDCNGNQLTKIDVSANKALTSLFCCNNQLTELNLESNNELHTLNCSDNQLNVLDISKNIKLLDLQCQNNKITKLDLQNNEVLTDIVCDNNKLSELDTNSNKELISLQCSNNQIAALSVNGSNKLETINCLNNQLTNLNVTQNTMLTYLNCGNNKLASLNVQNNNVLKGLYCVSNKLPELDVSKNPELTELYCYENQLTALDVKGNKQMLIISCWNNQLPALDLSENGKLEYFFCNNNQLSSLDVSKQTSLRILNCSDNYLTELILNEDAPLESLEFGNNQLTELNGVPMSVSILEGDFQYVAAQMQWLAEGWTVDLNKLVTVENLAKVKVNPDSGWTYNQNTGKAVFKGNTVPDGMAYYYSSYRGDMEVRLLLKRETICVVMKENAEHAVVNGVLSSTTQYATGYAKMENINGTMRMPLRYIAEVNGLSVNYDEGTGKTKVTNPATGEYMMIMPGNTLVTKYSAAGDELFTAEAPIAFINQNGVTMGPLRFTCEALGLSVFYRENSHGNFVVISPVAKTEEEALAKIEEAYQLSR